MFTQKILGSGFLILLLVLCTMPTLAYSQEATDNFTRGNTLMADKNYIQAIGAYEDAIAQAPDYFAAWNGKADALNRNQCFTEALAASDMALTLNPDYVQGWINRGYILYNLGRTDDELKAYDKAISIDPLSPTAWFNRGYSLASMKRYDDAISAFGTVKSLDPNYPNLAANWRIAEHNRDATTPWYIKNAITLGICAFFAIGAVVWFIFIRKEH